MMESFTWKLTHTVKCTTEHNAVINGASTKIDNAVF
jgi:hypothetical protein